MRAFSRRSALEYGAAGLTLAALPIPQKAYADNYVRYEASTTQGQAMVAKYANAVTLMKARQKGDPCSWLFQWYTHETPDPGKAHELLTLSVAQRPLATEMWDTCQNHPHAEGLMTTEDQFLPWHRMYVYYFEQICRSVLGDVSFTLPYWNYTDPSTTGIPLPFRDDTNPLFYIVRWEQINGCEGTGQGTYCVNSGDPIPNLNLDDLKQSTYTDFCSQLDRNLHSKVHLGVGPAGGGMTSLYWSPNDPIFWLHHCNIDRLWASWNAAGGLNPTDAGWGGQQFVFAQPSAGSCTRVVATTGAFSDISALGYSYDHLETPPPGKLKGPSILAHREPLLRSAGLTEIKRQGTGIRLLGRVSPSLSDRLSALTGDRRIYLLLDNYMTNAEPGVTYGIYFNLAGKLPSKANIPRAGTLTFFGAVMPPGRNMRMTVSFDVTDALRDARNRGVLNDAVELSILPDGVPEADAVPVVGSFALIEA
jgi:tyrosinase